MVIDDTVPAGTTVIDAGGSKGPVPAVAGQNVQWTVSLAGQETVTLTIEAQAGPSAFVTNTATFSNPQQILNASVQVGIYSDLIYLPLIRK